MLTRVTTMGPATAQRGPGRIDPGKLTSSSKSQAIPSEAQPPLYRIEKGLGFLSHEVSLELPLRTGEVGAGALYTFYPWVGFLSRVCDFKSLNRQRRLEYRLPLVETFRAGAFLAICRKKLRLEKGLLGVLVLTKGQTPRRAVDFLYRFEPA
jgi:hypothetical protein